MSSYIYILNGVITRFESFTSTMQSFCWTCQHKNYFKLIIKVLNNSGVCIKDFAISVGTCVATLVACSYFSHLTSENQFQSLFSRSIFTLRTFFLRNTTTYSLKTLRWVLPFINAQVSTFLTNVGLPALLTLVILFQQKLTWSFVRCFLVIKNELC